MVTDLSVDIFDTFWGAECLTAGFPTWAGNWAGRGGSDPITSPIKAQK